MNQRIMINLFPIMPYSKYFQSFFIMIGFLLPLLCVGVLRPVLAQTQGALSDEALLETIQRKSFQYFIDETDPETGLVRDRAHNFQKGALNGPASIAATGFGLTALGVGVERGWIDRTEAREISLKTLRFFKNRAAHERGFFYHFLHMKTGERANRSEASPIDTALFLAGALFVAEYFDDSELRHLAYAIYDRVDFQWMLNGGETLALAWTPEEGFNRHRWDHYDESMILYLLAIGSATYPIPESSWKAIARPVGSYKGHRTIQIAPLFTHQYSHIWIDFRNRNDGFADYFKNSREATLANRAFCIDQASAYASYGPHAWGLTASDGPYGYRAYGAPPGWAFHDGTLAPTGCGSSIVFTPEESLACLRHYYENLGDRLWGRYGFSDAFNLDKQWFDQEVIGIDQGALLLMIENHRSELIWKIMARNQTLQEAMKRLGFVPGSKELPWPEPPLYYAPYASGGLKIDSYLKDWPQGDAIILDKTFKERGQIENDKDLRAEIRLAWNEEELFFAVTVTDEDIVIRKNGKNIWMDDLFEIYIDPDDNGLVWDHADDYQLGFRAPDEAGNVAAWSWFQRQENPSEIGVAVAKGFVDQKGYVLEGSVRWSYLGLKPEVNTYIRIGLSVHDIDRDRSEGKIQWFFRNEEEFQRFILGKVVLIKGTLPPESKKPETPT